MALDQTPLQRFLYKYSLLAHSKQTWWVMADWHLSQTINLTGNLSTLRPLEPNVQPRSSVNEREHMHD